MARKSRLTAKHRAIIEKNIHMFPAEIKKLPGMSDPAISRAVIANYQRKVKNESENTDKEVLSEYLERYIQIHGLPSCYHGKDNVTGFLEYLKER